MRNLVSAIEAIDPLVVTGKVAGVNGLLIESKGGLSRLAVGARAEIERRHLSPLPAAANASASLPVQASASRCCCPCWPDKPPATSSWLV